MRRGDGDLLGLGVARQLDDLEAVLQRRRDLRPLVRGRDEEDLRQVEGDPDERVAKTALLLRIEYLEEHRGGRWPDLVHLVEHDDRVSVPDPPELAEDRAGLRPVPRAVVAPQVRVIVEAAARQPHVPAPHGLGDGLRQRGLPDRHEKTSNRRDSARIRPRGSCTFDSMSNLRCLGVSASARLCRRPG